MGEQIDSNTQIVRAGLDKAFVDFNETAIKRGFIKGKKGLWVRHSPYFAQFILFQRPGSTYGAPLNASAQIEVRFGIRVLNSDFKALALTGPGSSSPQARQGHYHLRFNAKSGSTYERCLHDLERILNEVGEPWFKAFSTPEQLISSPDAPLTPEALMALKQAMSGQSISENIALSLKLLGIKSAKR